MTVSLGLGRVWLCTTLLLFYLGVQSALIEIRLVCCSVSPSQASGQSLLLLAPEMASSVMLRVFSLKLQSVSRRLLGCAQKLSVLSALYSRAWRSFLEGSIKASNNLQVSVWD